MSCLAKFLTKFETQRLRFEILKNNILKLLRDAVHLKKLLLVKLDSERENFTSEFLNNCGSEGEVHFSEIVTDSDEHELKRQIESERRDTINQFKNQKIQMCTEIIGPYCGRFNFQEEYDLHQKHWHRPSF